MLWLNDDEVRNDFLVAYLFVELRFSANLSKVRLQAYIFGDDGKLR